MVRPCFSSKPAGSRARILDSVRDRSLWLLLAVNVTALGIAWSLNLSVGSLVFVYWLQSVVIGVMQVIRIAKLHRFVPDLSAKHDPVSEAVAMKRGVAVFFALHYGFFHLIYLVFILVATGGNVGDPLAVLACGGAFLLHHALWLQHELKTDAAGLPSLRRLMFMPYPRIIPMHVMILSGALFWHDAGPEGMLFFGALKTFADALMHGVARRGKS